MLLDYIVPVHKQTPINISMNAPNRDAGENIFGSSSSSHRSPDLIKREPEKAPASSKKAKKVKSSANYLLEDSLNEDKLMSL